MICIDDPVHGKALAVECSGGVPQAGFTPGWDHVIARVDEQGELMGGFLFDRYQIRSIWCHAAAFKPGWVTRRLLWAAAGYVFYQLGCEKIFAVMNSTKTATNEFIMRLGFSYETCLKEAVVGGDLAVWGLYRDDCRWLRYVPPELKERFAR